MMRAFKGGGQEKPTLTWHKSMPSVPYTHGHCQDSPNSTLIPSNCSTTTILR